MMNTKRSGPSALYRQPRTAIHPQDSDFVAVNDEPLMRAHNVIELRPDTESSPAPASAPTFTPTTTEPRRCFSIEELADYWGVTYGAVYRLIKAGKLKAFKVGIKWRVADDARQTYEDTHISCVCQPSPVTN